APTAINVTVSMRYCAVVAVAAGEDQRMVDVPAFESVPAPWSFSYTSPARAPVLPARASTRRPGGGAPTGADRLEGLGAPVLPKLQPETVKPPARCRKRR